jgi:hypothetical protein
LRPRPVGLNYPTSSPQPQERLMPVTLEIFTDYV